LQQWRLLKDKAEAVTQKEEEMSVLVMLLIILTRTWIKDEASKTKDRWSAEASKMKTGGVEKIVLAET